MLSGERRPLVPRRTPAIRRSFMPCRSADGPEIAVVLLGGDKTALGNSWYPTNLGEAEHRLDQYCRQDNAITR